MDPDTAWRQLTEYRELVLTAAQLPLLSAERRAAKAAANGLRVTVGPLLRGLAPDMRPLGNPSTTGDHLSALPRVNCALSLLDTWRRMTGKEGQAMHMLDPVVSAVAIPLWNAGKYRQAVADAATNVNRYAQERLGRHDIQDNNLMNEAFSSAPPQRGKSRLRCPGDHALMTVRDQQNGARQVAAGAFLAIRNPATHMTGDWNPQTAFHHLPLAILSQVAHWLREWDIAMYTPPPPDYNAILAAYQKTVIKQ